MNSCSRSALSWKSGLWLRHGLSLSGTVLSTCGCIGRGSDAGDELVRSAAGFSEGQSCCGADGQAAQGWPSADRAQDQDARVYEAVGGGGVIATDMVSSPEGEAR